jgi:hypothetical protein
MAISNVIISKTPNPVRPTWSINSPAQSSFQKFVAGTGPRRQWMLGSGPSAAAMNRRNTLYRNNGLQNTMDYRRSKPKNRGRPVTFRPGPGKPST